MKKYFTFTLALFLGIFARGQQDIQLSQQMFSKLNNNPAATGLSNYANAYLFARQQWAGFEGAPRTIVFNANTYLEQIRAGVGFSAFGDQVGNNNLFNVKAAYAYHVRIGRENYLSLGIGAGFIHRKFGGTTVNEPEVDPEIIRMLMGQSRWKADVDLGVTYSTPKFIVGLSATHVSRFLYTNDRNSPFDWFNLPMNAYGFAEYAIDLNKNVRLTPRAQVSSVFSTHRNDTLPIKDKIDWFYEFGALVEFKNKFWIGGTFRNDEAIIAMLGIYLGPNLRVGYAYDYKYFGKTFTNRRSFGSHELMVNYRIRIFDNDDQNIDFAPRFFD
ncbi:MAG: PorP/SprF family type IX secretion system membrane protein [Bacteroidales bacterium]|nr:PorP/SprF family type IX secretion system membrane protein [Bacteroidales bacterium]